MNINDLLLRASDLQASDLHLSTGMPPKVRVNGDLVDLDSSIKLTDSHLQAFIEQLLTEAERAQFYQDKEIDFAYAIGSTKRFRVNVFNQQRGLSIVCRIIATEIPSFEQLDLSEVISQLCTLRQGLVLVTGPTGCGKSTTLAAMIDLINLTMCKHILTLEDPIEFLHISKKSLVQQREVGSHTLSFSRALRSALREDPDVLLIGELRDLETVRLALTAAETGHLVLATLHTSSAAKTVSRIIDFFAAAEKQMIRAMLAESIQAVISQQLVKSSLGGQVAVREIMIGTSAIRNLIREDKLSQITSALQTGQQVGMCSFQQSANHLVKKGKIAHADLIM